MRNTTYIFLLFTIILIGCKKDGDTISSNSPTQIDITFPLEVGNEWQFIQTFKSDTSEFKFIIGKSIKKDTTINSSKAFIIETISSENNQNSSYLEILYNDSSGLYKLAHKQITNNYIIYTNPLKLIDYKAKQTNSWTYLVNPVLPSTKITYIKDTLIAGNKTIKLSEEFNSITKYTYYSNRGIELETQTLNTINGDQIDTRFGFSDTLITKPFVSKMELISFTKN